MLKDAAIISGMTVSVICGAIVGIVGGAISISLVAATLHIIMQG